MFYTVYGRLKHLIDPLLKIGKFIGIETLTAEILEIEELIDCRFKTPTDIDQILKGKPLIFWINRLMNVNFYSLFKYFFG